MISIAYYFGKSFLFTFYVLRAATAFNGSSMQFSKNKLIVNIAFINLLHFVLAIGWPIFQLPFTRMDIDADGKYYCIVAATAEEDYEYHNALTYFLIFATIIGMYNEPIAYKQTHNVLDIT